MIRCANVTPHLVSGYWSKHPWLGLTRVEGHSLTPSQPPWLVLMRHVTVTVEPGE